MEEPEPFAPEELQGRLERTALLVHAAMDEISEIREQLGPDDSSRSDAQPDPLWEADLGLTMAPGFPGEALTGKPAVDSFAALYANLALGFGELANSLVDMGDELEAEGETRS